jgi:hypothetical protein
MLIQFTVTIGVEMEYRDFLIKKNKILEKHECGHYAWALSEQGERSLSRLWSKYLREKSLEAWQDGVDLGVIYGKNKAKEKIKIELNDYILKVGNDYSIPAIFAIIDSI